MPDPHETILVRIADNGYGQDKFEYSGSFSDGWEHNPSFTLRWRNDCSGDIAGKVYKFDQSDSSNANYRLGFSHTDDAYNSTGVQLGEASGVFYYGTPGQAGASTKVNVGIMFSGQPSGYANGAPLIHAFAVASTSYDYGENYFNFADTSGEGCTSGDYTGPPTGATSSSATSSSATSSSTGPSSSSATSSSTTSSSTGPTSSSATSSSVTSSSSASCNQSTAFSGQLNTLINTTNSTQSGKYGNFTTVSYTQATGVETGQFSLGAIIATGTSLSNALTDLTPLLSHFNASGVVIDELNSASTSYNINNNTTSYSTTFSGYNGSAYYQGATGYVSKRYYVGYNPQISGNYTGANVTTTCPETSIQVTFDRNRKIYNTTGEISPAASSITQFVATLQSSCTGYLTTLDVSCLKFENGEQKYGKVTFFPYVSDAWSGIIDAGSYVLRHESGSFTTALGLHTLGSGTLNVDRYV
jgi:hypothetical protein